MQVDRFGIEGPLALTPKRHEDDRGWFAETFREDLFQADVGKVNFVQHGPIAVETEGNGTGASFPARAGSARQACASLVRTHL